MLHAAALTALVLFKSVVLTEPQRTSKTILFTPMAVPKAVPPSPLIRPKLRAVALPKLPAPDPSQSVRRPSLIEAPAIQVESAPMVRTSPAIQVPQAPQPIAPAVKAAGFDDAAARKIQNEPKRAATLELSPSGFDSGDAEKIQNEPKRIAAAGFGSLSAEHRPITSRSPLGVTEGVFGGAAAGDRTAMRAPLQTVRAGFGDTVAAAVSIPNRPSAPQPAEFAPVEITYKPKPAYTDEARRLQIEGEVVIEVVFTASGAVEIVRIIRGLGHGLDENATAAARSIRFHPAKQHGRPVESTATVRMSFELAY